MATKYMNINYQGKIGTEQEDGTFIYEGSDPDYATLLPLTLDGLVFSGGGGGGYRDQNGHFGYAQGFGSDAFLYDDSNENAILACYGACGFSRYVSVDVAYSGTNGVEPTRNYY